MRRIALALIVSLAGCGGVATASRAPVEVAVRQISLAGPLARRDAEISGLAWDGERLLLLPQYPEFAGPPAIYSLGRADIEAHVAGARPGPLTPTAIAFVDAGVPGRIAGFHGYEAIAVAGADVWLSIEAETAAGSQGHVVRGALAADRSAISLDPASLVAVPAQTHLRNHSEEALVIAGDRLLVLHEINGVAVNPRPVAHSFDLALAAVTTLPMTPLEYRLTDATALDAGGRFWVINYFFPREHRLRARHDPIAADHGEGPSHAAHATVERLVELELRGGQIVRGPSPPIALELLGDHASRNWEGVVRLGERGFLLATDRHPETLLVFVPR
jgi:hypothetical protein